MSLLIIDDHHPTLVALQAILTPLGHEILVADSAAAALGMLATREFAAILCDVRMPGMDGFEMVARLRAQGLARGTPVVLLSAEQLSREDICRAFALGAADCLPKPTDPEIFRSRIGALVYVYQAAVSRERPAAADNDLAQRSAAIAREAERLISSKDAFVRILGHDLRNPLSSVLVGCKRLAQAPDLPAAYRVTAERVLRSADRMHRMIRDILDFARTSSGASFPISPRRTDLGEIAAAVVEELREGHPNRRIELAIAGDPRVDCDPERISQALGNLVVNAIQHGQDPISVSAACEEQQITVEVHNAGPPIPEQALQTLFDPYRRRDDRGGGGGLGLGLHIVQEIVRAHGGAVAVQSSGTAGTTFRLHWPRGARSDANADGQAFAGREDGRAPAAAVGQDLVEGLHGGDGGGAGPGGLVGQLAE